MNDEEQALADYVYAAIQDAATSTERSQQQKEFRVGISNIGHCSTFLKKLIQEEVPDHRIGDHSAAFIGTAIGDYVERAVQAKWPGSRTQEEFTVHLKGSIRDYEILGHADIVTPNAVLDFKTVAGFERIKRKGPSRQQLFQRHLYALGCHQAGLFDVPLEEVRTGNVWIDRSANERGCFVHLDRYSPQIVAEAVDWLDEVTYGVMNDTEVPKEPSREFCRDWCGYYGTCRAGDSDASGVITDPDLLAAIDVWHDGMKLEKQAKKLKAEASGALLGVGGNTPTHSVRWVHVNGGHVEYDRKEYERLSINPLPPPRRK